MTADLPGPALAGGWLATFRLGLVVPHADVGPEAEAQALLGAHGTVHGMRVAFDAMRADGVMDPKIPHAPVISFTQPPAIDDATALLAQSPLDAIGLAFTSSSYTSGAHGEDELLARLREPARGIPVITTCVAALEAMAHLNVQRPAVFNPPWFDDRLNRHCRDYFSSRGLSLSTAVSVDLPSDQRAIAPAALTAAIQACLPADADAVFIAGNGQPALAALAGLEATTGVPALSANQVLVWSALRAAGYDTSTVPGPGTLFSGTGLS